MNCVFTSVWNKVEGRSLYSLHFKHLQRYAAKVESAEKVRSKLKVKQIVTFVLVEVDILCSLHPNYLQRYGTLIDECCKELMEITFLTVCLPSFGAMLKGNMLVSNIHKDLLEPTLNPTFFKF